MSEQTGAGDLLPFLHSERVVRTGTAIVALFFFGFLGWAALAPLESAVVSPGVLTVQSLNGREEIGVSVRVRAEDAEDVRTGMAAKVDLSAHTMRRLPMLTGLVAGVSPRALEDPRSGQAYFLARVSLDTAPLAGYPEIRLLPGMPVQVEIPTGAHTALTYFIEPISEVMHTGMREK